MTTNFDIKALLARLSPSRVLRVKDPRILMRVVLGILLTANIVVALVLFRPWGSTPEEMEQQLGALRAELAQKQQAVARMRTLVEKSRRARKEGDAFMKGYFMNRQTASSTIISELKESAAKAGIKQQEQTFAYKLVEGSDDLYMLTISGTYEGRYEDLVNFINLLDKSPRFLILDTLTAAPERSQGGGLAMNFKMTAFVVDGPRRVSEAEKKATGPEENKDKDAGAAGERTAPPETPAPAVGESKAG